MPALRGCVLYLSLSLSAFLLLPGMASAQQGPSPGECTCRLGGHRFLLSEQLSNPFIMTQVHTTTGGGIASGFEAIVDLPAQDSTVARLLGGDLAFVNLGFDFQWNFWNRLAAGIGVAGNARVGIDGESIIAQGVTTAFTSELWLKGRLFTREKDQLSAQIRLRPSSVVALDPIGWAERIIDEGELAPDNRIVRTTDALSVGLGLSYGWAVRDWLGLTIGGEAGFGNPLDDEFETDLRWLLDSSASIDLVPVNGWPLGFLVGFRWDQFPESASDIIDRNRVSVLGAYYTGAEQFSIGLEVTNSSSTLTTSDATLDATVGTFEIRYFF